MPPDVIIAGGGVVGCAAAYYLAGAGCRVTLYERGRIGGEASGAAAGILGPLAESPAPGPFLDLAVAGLRAFQEDVPSIEAVSGIGVEYTPTGVLRPATGTARAAALQRSLGLAEAAGLPAAWLDAASLRRLEPELAQGVVGALFSPEEAHVRPARLVLALAQGAARRGATLVEGVEIHGVTPGRSSGAAVSLGGTAEERADIVLLCGGAWSRFFTGLETLEAHPVRGQYVLLRATPAPIRHIIYGERCYAVPRLNGTIYIGATEEPEAGYRKAVTVNGARTLLAAAQELVPRLGAAELAGSGSGLRPGTADRLPFLGMVPGCRGVAVATGHFRNGVLLSLITGRLLAELLAYGRPSIDLEPFSPAREAAGPAAAKARRYRPA